MNWNQYIKSFQHYLKLERGLSQNTIDNYTFDLQRLCSYLDQNSISVSPINIQEETIQQFIYTISKELNARTQARILSGLKAFFNYLIFEDYRNSNPMELIESPKIARKLPDTLSINEIDKLKIILPKGHTITPKDIEENIGFSKDFNNFELRKAIGEKNVFKAFQIIDNFAQNPKDNPIVVTTGLVFGFFSQLLQYHGLKDKSQFNAAKVLKVSPYFIKDYEVAFRNYPMKKVSAIVATLRDIDVKSKGVGASSMSQHDLLKEMLIKIFN